MYTEGNFLSSNRPYLRVLTESQLEELHFASLRVLEKTGMIFHLPEAVEILLSTGCRKIDENRISIPSHLVEDALRNAPKQIRISDREGNPAMLLSGRNCYYGTGSDLPNVIDPYTGKKRRAQAKDVGMFSKISDYAPNIDFVMSMGLASDVPGDLVDLHHFSEMVKNTTLPILFTAANLIRLKDIHMMCIAVRGSEEKFEREPFVVHYSEPISPLQHSKDGLQKLLYCADHSIPITYPSGTSLGATAPVTIAGAMVMSNVEFLGGLVLGQLKRKGAPFIYGGGNSAIDMRTTSYTYAAPEDWLNGMINRELSAYYDLPCFGEGGCCDAEIFDEQAASEATSSLWLCSLIGQNLIHDVGYAGKGLTGSCETLLLSDEVISQVKRFLRGVQVDEDAMAVDVLHRIGPGGNFLTDDHTLKHFRTELWNSTYFNKTSYNQWVEDGEKPLRQVLNEQVQWILKNHTPTQINSSVEEAIEDIINNAERFEK
jgi:trimethylamine--corrinoid protein Co-methyltransferase